MQKRFLAGLTVAALLGGLASCSLDPEISVALNVSTAGVVLWEGSTATGSITYSTIPTDATVTFTSSNESVATVSSAGVVTKVGPGAALITVSATKDGDTLHKVVPVSVAGLIAHYGFEIANINSSTKTVSSVGGTVNPPLVLASYDGTTAGTTSSYSISSTKEGSYGIYWPNLQLGGTISAGGLIPSGALGISIGAYVKLVVKDYTNFVNFVSGKKNERFDYPNLTLNDGTNIWPGKGWGSCETGHAYNDFYTTSSFADGNGWVHLFLVINAVDNSVSYYINGDLMVTYTSTDLSDDIENVITAAQTGSLVFGYQNWTDGESAIDDLRIYSGPLNASWISTIYAGL